MEITLEKIELVKDRTGVSYKEAKEALEAADGSVVDAIINIEESIDEKSRKTFGEQGAAVIDSIKDLVKKGNVSKIVVKKKDGDAVVNIPVNVGIIGIVLAPWGMLAGAIAAFGFKCVVEIVKTDGTIIDVSERASDAMSKAVEKGSEFADAAKDKGSDVYEKVKGSDIYDKVKSSETVNKVKDAAGDAVNKTSDALKSRKNKAASDFADTFADIDEKADDFKEKAAEKADDIREKAADVADKIEKAAKKGEKE